MNCAEAEKQLGEFLDKTLEVDRARELESHLAACSRCSAELASLTDYQRLVSRLSAVDEPGDFTARVMARVNQAGRRPHVWERLLLPVQLKIPLQATAIVVIGILAIYLYQKEKTDPSSLPRVSGKHLSRQSEEENKAAITGQAPSGVEKKYDSDSGSKSKGSAKETVKPTSRAGTSSQSSNEPPPSAPATSTAERSDSVLPDRKEEFTSRPKASPEAAVPPSIDSLREGAGAASADKALSSQAQPAPDYELVVRLRSTAPLNPPPSGRADTLRKREERDTEGETRQGSITAQTPAFRSPDSAPQIIWYTVPLGRYEEFKKELADQGVIEFETSASDKERKAARKPQENLSIKVTILPPR